MKFSKSLVAFLFAVTVSGIGAGSATAQSTSFDGTYGVEVSGVSSIVATRLYGSFSRQISPTMGYQVDLAMMGASDDPDRAPHAGIHLTFSPGNATDFGLFTGRYDYYGGGWWNYSGAEVNHTVGNFGVEGYYGLETDGSTTGTYGGFSLAMSGGGASSVASGSSFLIGYDFYQDSSLYTLTYIGYNTQFSSGLNVSWKLAVTESADIMAYIALSRKLGKGSIFRHRDYNSIFGANG